MAMRLLVIDGQGGGVGSRLVASLREKELPNVEVICVGTNVLATNAMLKAGADAGATGENAVVYNAARGCDFGPDRPAAGQRDAGRNHAPNGARHLGKQRTEAIDPCFQMCG